MKTHKQGPVCTGTHVTGQNSGTFVKMAYQLTERVKAIHFSSRVYCPVRGVNYLGRMANTQDK